jgi:hypothetical protein
MLFKAILFILCAPTLLLAQEAHYFNYGGINNQDDSMLIADRDAQDARNILTDEGDMRTIYGNTLFTTVAASSITFAKEWINSSGQHILFVKSGTGLYATSATSGTLTNIITVADTAVLDMVPAFGAAYFVDGSVTPFYTTGGAKTAATGFEDCKYTEFYATRLVCVNMSTDTSKIMLSAYNSSTSWTTTASKDSGATKYFNKDDGEDINCVFTTPAGLFIGKNSSVGMLKGTDNESFYWYGLSEDIGCVDDRLVQLVDGELIWLSKEGYYAYDFAKSPRPISRKIEASTKLIRRGSSSDVVWNTNTQAAWKLGTGTGWDYDVAPGSIKVETYNSGALADSNPILQTMFSNAGFELGALTNWTGGEGVVACAGSCVGSYWSYRNIGAGASNPYVRILKASDDSLISSYTLTIPLPGAGTTCADHFFSAVPTGYNIKLITGAGGIGDIATSMDYTSGNSVGFRACVSNSGIVYHDFFDDASIFTTAISASTDSLLTAPIFSLDVKGKLALLNWYASDDNSTFTSTQISIPGGLVPAAYNKRYYKYSVTLASGVAVSSFTSVTVSAISTSTYRSVIKFTDADITAWKLFSVSDSGTASPSYSIRSATYVFIDADTVPAFTAHTKNSAITVGTGTYVQFLIDPNVFVSTDSLTVSLVGLTYTKGTLSPSAASVVDDGRYIASVSHNSSTKNDITYIWQKNKEWMFSDHAYGALGEYNNKPLAGSTSISSKLWNIMDPLAYSFDGTSINSYWTTKDFTFGEINKHKVIQRLWITADNGGLDSFGIAWQANRDAVWVSTSTTLNDSNFIVKEVNGLFETQYPGRQFRFRFTGNELDKYFRMKLYSIYYKVNPLIKD